MKGEHSERKMRVPGMAEEACEVGSKLYYYSTLFDDANKCLGE